MPVYAYYGVICSVCIRAMNENGAPVEFKEAASRGLSWSEAGAWREAYRHGWILCLCERRHWRRWYKRPEHHRVICPECRKKDTW